MASRPVKLKLAPRSTLKLKAIPRLPAAIHGTNGITVTLSGLTYTIGLDTDTGGFVTLTGVQTLTNKTLTSPTINGGTITSATVASPIITTPSITGASPLRIRSSGANAFDLAIKNTETLTTLRSLTLTMNDADRTIDLGGNLVLGGATTLGAILQGDLWYGSASGVMSALNKSTTATRYLSNTGTSNSPAWAQVDLSNGVTGDLPFANLTQGSARSVLGVTGNSTADVASIQGTSNQVLVINSAGTALAFGQVNLSSGSAVTGDLPFANIAQISGYSLVGNTSSGTADIAGFTVGGLTQKATPAGTDLVLIQDQAASGQLKYATVSSVGSSSGVSSIAGNTGAFTLSRGITNSANDIRLAQYYMQANLSSDQSVTSTTKTKCQFNTEVHDPQGWYDNATNYRFTPLVAGKYLVTVSMYVGGTTVSGVVLGMIYKNGSEFSEALNSTTSSNGCAVSTCLVDMNGSTDYIEGWGRVTASASPVFVGGTAPVTCWMSICYVGP